MTGVAAAAVSLYLNWLQPADPLQLFRFASLLVLALVIGRLRSTISPTTWRQQSPVILLCLIGLWWPALGPIALTVWAWRATGRVAAAVICLLLLPLDPWFAGALQWPLQVVTAELGGWLSAIPASYELGHPIHGDTVYIEIPCAAFCDVASHNVAPGMPGYEPFRINEQCAGLHQVETMWMLTSVIVLLVTPALSRAHELLLLAIAPLVAIVVNGLRVAASVHWGRFAQRGPWDGMIHDLPGYIIFAVAIYAVALTARRLERRGQ